MAVAECGHSCATDDSDRVCWPSCAILPHSIGRYFERIAHGLHGSRQQRQGSIAAIGMRAEAKGRRRLRSSTRRRGASSRCRLRGGWAVRQGGDISLCSLVLRFRNIACRFAHGFADCG